MGEFRGGAHLFGLGEGGLRRQGRVKVRGVRPLGEREELLRNLGSAFLLEMTR